MSGQQQDLRQIYHHIIDDVVAKMKPGFLQESVDESVLQTIRQRWAQKLTEKGIISEPEPQPEPAPVKKDDEQASRKRPYDGTAPNNRQEAAAAAAGLPPGAGVNMPMKGPPPHMQMRPQGQAVGPGMPGMRPGQPQMPMARGMGPGGMSAQQLQGLPPQTNMILQTALANVQGLPAHQQQAALHAQLQALSRMAAKPQGMPAGAMPGQAQVAGMHMNQGLAAGQQLQGLRGPGLPANVLAQQQNLQQQVLQHQMMQQQVMQQQQQQQRMQGLPAGVPPNIQGLLQQQQGVVQRIPQGDGSSDMPPSVAEVAAAAGMPPERLRAMLPRRIAAVMDRSSEGNSRGALPAPASISQVPAELVPGPTVAAASGPAAAAGSGAGSSRAGAGHVAAGRKQQQQRRRRQRSTIPQLDGEDDDEEDYAGGYEGGDDGEDGAAADEGEEEEAEDEESEGESDDPELAKFTAELDDLEEADKEETGDVGFALYEKVHRAKNRWRCNLRYGVFLINNKEYMFNKGSTDFTF